MFKVAKSTKVFQNVVDQIQEAILDGRLKIGQSLPSERELKEMFGISRGTLREALRVLEQKGLIEIRLGVGGGSIVTALRSPVHIEQLNALLAQARQCLAEGLAGRDDFIEIDKQIHMTLAEITANPIYIFVLHSIHENIHRYYDRFLSMEIPELEENYQFLSAVVAAIETGDGNLASELVQDHVKRFNRYMESREQTEPV